MPFYQPLASLELFERAIAGKDLATGTRTVRPSYKTRGTAKSTYREGNATVQFVEVPQDATYNTTTNEPNPVNGTETKREVENKRRSLVPVWKVR